MEERPKLITLDPAVTLFLTTDEAAGVVSAWAAEARLHCLLLQWLPFSCGPFDRDLPKVAEANEAWFDTHPFNLLAQNSTALAISSRESLRFRLPKRTEKGLVQGSLGSLAVTASQKELWSSMVGVLLASLKRGMWVHNTSTRRTFFVERHYYSASAKDLNKEGVPLVVSSGNDVFFPEKPH